MASEIKVDTISEKTSANGVTIDGVSLKDSKIATANSVDSDAYVDASIDNAHLADNAVDTAEIADNAVTLAKMDGLARGKLIYGDASGDPAALAVGGADEVLTHDGTDLAWAAAGGITAANFRPNAKPLIINGDMAVAQRGTSFAAEGEQYTLDRWYYEKNNDGVVTITQEALTADEAYEDGFSTAIKVDVTTADTDFTTNQRAFIEYIIEAQDLQLVKKGTANAEKLTLAFWVKATKTGTNVVRFYAYDSDRSCSQAYTISSTDTWEFKVLNFPADTTGVINNDNGQGLKVSWGMAAGPTYTSGTLATTWETNTSANDFVGQVNNFDSTSNNFHITGVQLEVGEYTSSTLPPFQHESYGNNLQRCLRYFYRMLDGNAKSAATFSYYSASRVEAGVSFPVTMRIAPSLISTSGASYFRVQRNGGDNNLNDFSGGSAGLTTGSIYNTDEASGTAGNAGFGYSRANGYLSWDSEF